MEIIYPEGTSAPEHQVAGHVHGEGKTKLGILQGIGTYKGELLKPGGRRELDFYQHVNYSNHKSDIFPDNGDKSTQVRLTLMKLLPIYHGSLKLNIGSNTEDYARLSDISVNFTRPSIMDIKIGVENADPLADEEKRAKERAKFPALPKVKFMLTGMKYVNEDNEYIKVEKKVLRSYEYHEVGVKGLNRFLPLDFTKRAFLLHSFISELQRIEAFFKVQKLYEFHASSILFTYESADIDTYDTSIDTTTTTTPANNTTTPANNTTTPVNNTMTPANNTSTPVNNTMTPANSTKKLNNVTITPNTTTTIPNTPSIIHHNGDTIPNTGDTSMTSDTSASSRPKFDVTMIDFAHVFPSRSHDIDCNYLAGVQSLIRYFQQLLLLATAS